MAGINQLIEKVLVSEPVEIDGHKIQRLTIHDFVNNGYQSPIPTIQQMPGSEEMYADKDHL